MPGGGLRLALERRLDFGECAGKGRDGTGESVDQGGAQGIADHRVVVGDQECPRLGRRVGHPVVVPRSIPPFD